MSCMKSGLFIEFNWQGAYFRLLFLHHFNFLLVLKVLLRVLFHFLYLLLLDLDSLINNSFGLSIEVILSCVKIIKDLRRIRLDLFNSQLKILRLFSLRHLSFILILNDNIWFLLLIFFFQVRVYNLIILNLLDLFFPLQSRIILLQFIVFLDVLRI